MKVKNNSEKYVVDSEWIKNSSFVTMTCIKSSGQSFICSEIDTEFLILRIHNFKTRGIVESRGKSVEALKLRAFSLMRSLGYSFKNEKNMLTLSSEGDTINNNI